MAGTEVRPRYLGSNKVNYGSPLKRQPVFYQEKISIQELARLCGLVYKDGKVG